MSQIPLNQYATTDVTIIKNLITKIQASNCTWFSCPITASNINETSTADNQLTGALKSLFAVAENYPELKANANFKELQEELSDTEDKIAYSRQFYNDTVLMYNNKCEQFPSNIFAGMFNFKLAEFYKAPERAATVPKVEF